jgi:hypothetical protein
LSVVGFHLSNPVEFAVVAKLLAWPRLLTKSESQKTPLLGTHGEKAVKQVENR